MKRMFATITLASWLVSAGAAGAQPLVGENGTGAFAEEGAWNAQGGGDSLREAARTGRSIALGGQSYTLGVPSRYVVRAGDTLWDICRANLRNAWLWPQVWSLNPEVTNPHWIYPGQILRLRPGGSDQGAGSPLASGLVSGGSVFFRNQGFVEKDLEEAPGTIVAAWEDEMLLSYPDLLYVRFDEDFPVQAGQQYTVYRPRETVYDNVEDEDGDPIALGRIVEILGTVTVLSFDQDSRLARVRVIESINPIERGDAVGPIERNFVVSEPRAADVDLDGTIVATLRPRLLQGEGFVVFVNRGFDDGVRNGNRFQIIRATDHYLASMDMDVPPDLPFEWIGECHVVEARKTASTCLITSSRIEMGTGDRVTLIRGQ